jgi:WD40 repeat protein
MTKFVDCELSKNRQQLKTFRPQGLLLHTLYGHEAAVNTISVSYDNKWFISGSRDDGQINIWNTYDIEQNKKSSPNISLKSVRGRVNQVSFLENSNHFAIAG